MTYSPKFCRTRGCNLPFEHEAKCKAPQAVSVPFHGKTAPAYGVTVYYRPSKSPRMRHGTDPNPRRSVYLRALDVHRGLRARVAMERAMTGRVGGQS